MTTDSKRIAWCGDASSWPMADNGVALRRPRVTSRLSMYAAKWIQSGAENLISLAVRVSEASWIAISLGLVCATTKTIRVSR